MSKVMTLFAGVNGSGKSTLCKLMLDYVGVAIDPDKVARDKNLNSLEAGREVIRKVEDCIREGISFSLETTLSGNLPFRQIDYAKSHGYYVRMFYVGISDVQLNIKRIRTRVLQGGHHIPDEDVLRRYPRSMANMKKALQVCDEVLIYDNTVELELVSIIENGTEVYRNKGIEVSWLSGIKNLKAFD